MGGLGATCIKPQGGPKPPPAPKVKKIQPMSRQLASKITAVAQRLSELVAWESKLDSAKTPILINGFKNELRGRQTALQAVRNELETLYVEDDKINEPANADHKEKCMLALRNAENAFQSYAGSIKSVTAVVESSPLYWVMVMG
eukprot:s322_g16.t1